MTTNLSTGFIIRQINILEMICRKKWWKWLLCVHFPWQTAAGLQSVPFSPWWRRVKYRASCSLSQVGGRKVQSWGRVHWIIYSDVEWIWGHLQYCHWWSTVVEYFHLKCAWPMYNSAATTSARKSGVVTRLCTVEPRAFLSTVMDIH